MKLGFLLAIVLFFGLAGAAEAVQRNAPPGKRGSETVIKPASPSVDTGTVCVVAVPLLLWGTAAIRTLRR